MSCPRSLHVSMTVIKIASRLAPSFERLPKDIFLKITNGRILRSARLLWDSASW